MGLRRSRHMDDVRLGFFQHLSHTTKEAFNMKPLAKLFCHEQFPVAGSNSFAPIDALDGPGMGIRDLAASRYRNLKHILRFDSFRRIEPVLRWWRLSVSRPTVASTSGYCNHFLSIPRSTC